MTDLSRVTHNANSSGHKRFKEGKNGSVKKIFSRANGTFAKKKAFEIKSVES